jgi:hypothetical protein
MMLAYSFTHLPTLFARVPLKKHFFIWYTHPDAYAECIHTLATYLKSHVNMLDANLKARVYSKKLQKNINYALSDGVYGLF